MPQDMNRKVVIPRDVTGSGAPRDRSPHAPHLPGPIATSAAHAPLSTSPWTGPRDGRVRDIALPAIIGQRMIGPDAGAVKNEPGLVNY